MIGKPDWFTYRQYGWGIRPKTWQGWFYALSVALLIGLLITIGLNNSVSIIMFIALLTLVFIDAVHIMFRMPKQHNESENHKELLIERSVSYAAIFGLIAIMIYKGALYRTLDTALLILFGIMVIAKGATVYYLESRKK